LCAGVSFACLCFAQRHTATSYYALVSIAYFFVGYWCVLLTTSAEQFGTNIRATVATSVPNVVRGTTVPITLSFLTLSGYLGIHAAVCIIGVVVFAIAAIGLMYIKESFGRDLSFIDR
jgi:MFS transporter, putative metabolite:H+ symporter